MGRHATNPIETKILFNPNLTHNTDHNDAIRKGGVELGEKMDVSGKG